MRVMLPSFLKQGSWSKRSKRRLATVAACLLAAFLSECLCWGLRVVLYPSKWSKNSNTGRLRPDFRGAVLHPNAVQVNSFGLRGAEPKLASTHAPNRLRIYCVGNSTTFGTGASTDADTYPAQLEKILKERYPNYELEVINAGVPGNSSETELRLLKADLPRLHPDVVIFWSGWIDFWRYLKFEDLEDSEDSGAQPSKRAKFLGKSNTLRFVKCVRDSVTPEPNPPAFETFADRPESTGFRTSALTAWRKNLDAMIAACAQENASVLFLGLPSPFRHPINSWNELTRLQASRRLCVLPRMAPVDIPRGLQDFEHEIEALSARHSSLSDVMYGKLCYISAEKLPEQVDLFSDGVHMSNSGYTALAEAVAAQLEQQLTLKR